MTETTIACILCDDGGGLVCPATLANWSDVERDPRGDDPDIDDSEPGIWWDYLGVCPNCAKAGKVQGGLF